ncbi:MAG TPA: hypothetical protein VI248_02415 [Kineosporiaceae bacterium]
MDSTEDRQHNDGGYALSRVASPLGPDRTTGPGFHRTAAGGLGPVMESSAARPSSGGSPVRSPSGVATDVRDRDDPVDPSLVSPPTGIALTAPGVCLPLAEPTAAAPVLGATLRPPLARATPGTLGVSGGPAAGTPWPPAGGAFGTSEVAGASGIADWGVPFPIFPQLPQATEEGGAVPPPLAMLARPTVTVPDATAEIHWFAPVVEPQPAAWHDEPPLPSVTALAPSDQPPSAVPALPGACSGQADPATVALPIPAGGQPPLSRRARREAEQAGTPRERPGAPEPGAVAFEPAAVAFEPAAAAPLPDATEPEDLVYPGSWASVPCSPDELRAPDAWPSSQASGGAPPMTSVEVPTVARFAVPAVGLPPVVVPPVPMPSSGREVPPPPSTSWTAMPAPAMPPLAGMPDAPAAPEVADRVSEKVSPYPAHATSSVGLFPGLGMAASDVDAAEPAGPVEGAGPTGETVVLRRAARDRGGETRRTSMPVIRPPAQLRRPDDDEPSDVTTRTLRAVPADGTRTTELFTAPAARAKDTPGRSAPRPPEVGDVQPVANLAPPVPPPAVPQPVAPKSPSLEVPLDPSAMAAKAASDGSTKRRATVPVSVRVPLTGRQQGPSVVTMPLRTDAGSRASGGTAQSPATQATSGLQSAAVLPAGATGVPPASSPGEAGPGGLAGPRPGVATSAPPVAAARPPAVAEPASRVAPAGVVAGLPGQDAGEGAAVPLAAGARGSEPLPWDALTDPARPATTIVPSRSKGVRGLPRASRPAKPADADSYPVDDQVSDDLEETERSPLVSLIVFWAPAIILLLLAALVVWVVR